MGDPVAVERVVNDIHEKYYQAKFENELLKKWVDDRPADNKPAKQEPLENAKNSKKDAPQVKPKDKSPPAKNEPSPKAPKKEKTSQGRAKK